MKRIAICTLFHKNYNYGGVLQAYATQKVLADKGYEAEIISFDDAKSVNPIYPTNLSRIKQYSVIEVVKKISEIINKKYNTGLQKKLQIRYSLYKDFVKRNVSVSKIYSDENINDIGKSYDVFISGSDQVWNPNAVNNLYLQNFQLKEGAKRISYAASIGRDGLSKWECNIMIPLISKFDYISVREKSAKEILKRHIDSKDISVVCDPTILLPSVKWDEVACERMIQDPYVIMYAFSECRFINHLIDYYRNKGIKCYYIPYAKNSPNSFDEKYHITPLFDVGPSQFISLIKHSEMVVTDSFHGSVFSVIYNKPFIVFERDNNNNKTSKNCRIYDLLNTLKLSNRLVTESDIPWTESIDYTTTNSIINEMRNMSLNWLIDAIESH
jgi:hypothetical protein